MQVGNKRRIVLDGEYTGPIVVKAKAKELGIDLADEKLNQVLNSVRESLQGRKTSLTDEEFLSIITKVGYKGFGLCEGREITRY